MLPTDRRLRRSEDFTQVFRGGARAAAPSVVVHVRRLQQVNPPGTTRVGFVVSKKVGNAVNRNRVKRRLRHLVRGLETPYAADVVVRALPGAATSDRLAADVASAWRRAFSKAETC